MQTSSFKISGNDARAISIALKPPNGSRGQPKYEGRVYDKLYPSPELILAYKADEITKEEYTKRYTEETLSKLDPAIVYKELGEDSILLCFEEPGKFCHRRIAAQWMETALGVSIPERRVGVTDGTLFDREEVRKGLEMLYPPEHGIIEGDAAIKGARALSSGQFDDREKLLDEIEKLDEHDKTQALYTGLNRKKQDRFKPDNKIKSGRGRGGGETIEKITGILVDIDPVRVNGDIHDSTSAEEHQAGLDAGRALMEKLSELGWPQPVYGSSCNGAALRYVTDLPKEQVPIIRELLVKLGMMLPDDLKGKVDVDKTTHDLPRITKVFGTLSRKGQGFEDRPWRRSRIISAPEKLQPVTADMIKALLGVEKFDKIQAEINKQSPPEKGKAGEQEPRIKELSDVANDPRIRPCLKEILLRKDIKRLEEVSAHEHKGRVALCTELMVAGYSDKAIHEFFSRMGDYDQGKTTAQLKSFENYILKGGKPWRCKKLREDEVTPVARCKNCQWGSAAPVKVEWNMGYFVNLRGQACLGTVKNEKNDTNIISDGYAYISAVLENVNGTTVERSFVIEGRSINTRPFKRAITAEDASEKRKLNAMLTNEFGRDPVKKLTLEVIQRLSRRDVPYTRVYSRPLWLNGEMIAPRLVEDENTFDYPQKVFIDFRTSGDPSVGKLALENGINAFDKKNSVLLVATIIGAPIIGLIWVDERFVLFIQATTGMKKTAALMLFMTLYGVKYGIEANLTRWGDGATMNAAEQIAAKTGPFPLPYDNYKNYTDQDSGKAQRLFHAICEGGEKDRLNKNSTLKPTDAYQCTPIVTGEDYPGNDAATRARFVQVDWTDAKDLGLLTDAQKHTHDLNAFGREWLKWLSSEDGKKAIKDQAARFDEVRTHYLKKAGNAVNAGRIASNAAVIMLTWEIFGQWSEGHEIAVKYAPILKAAIDEHVLGTKADVLNSLDSEKFMAWLKAEIQVGRYQILHNPDAPDRYNPINEVIGEYRDGTTGVEALLITPEILSAKLYPSPKIP